MSYICRGAQNKKIELGSKHIIADINIMILLHIQVIAVRRQRDNIIVAPLRLFIIDDIDDFEN